MASIIIRGLDDCVKDRLRLQAARHGRSMEQEAREILKAAVSAHTSRKPNLAEAIRSRFAPLGGVDIPAKPREPIRQPPKFR